MLRLKRKCWITFGGNAATQILSAIINSAILSALPFDKNVEMFYYTRHWSGSELTYFSSLAQRACISVAFKFLHGC